MAMEIAVERRGTEVVVFVTGEVNNEDVDAFRDGLFGAFDETLDRFVVDVSRLSYLNSAGVGAIAGLQRLLKQHGRRLIIRDPRAAIERLLRVTRLDTVISVEWSER